MACACRARTCRPSPANRSGNDASPRSRASRRPQPMSPERQESFNRLAWTMAGLAAALGPHLLRMQAWVSAFVIGTCAWRLLAERRGWRMPPAFLRALVAEGVTVGVVVGYSTITGLDGGTDR